MATTATIGPAALAAASASMTQAAQVAIKLLAGTELFGRMRDQDVQIGTTPKDLVFSQDKVRLYQFRPRAERRVRIPVLIAYGLVGRWTITDLQEDRSLVRNLLDLGQQIQLQDDGQRHHLRQLAAQTAQCAEQIGQAQPRHVASALEPASRRKLQRDAGEVAIKLHAADPPLAQRGIVQQHAAIAQAAHQHDEMRHVPVQHRGQRQLRQLRRLQPHRAAGQVQLLRNIDHILPRHALEPDGMPAAQADQVDFVTERRCAIPRPDARGRTVPAAPA